MSASDRFNFDAAALSQMENIRRIGQRMLRNRADLDDFVQETLLRAYSKQHQLRDAEKFDRWIAAIARNLAREWNRKKREEPMEELPEQIDWRTPHDAVEEAERNRRLYRAMESLNPADRELLRARYMEDASYAELQARHGLSYSAVALRIHRAKKRLRKILKSIGAALVFVFGGFKRAAWGGVLFVSNTTKIVVGTAVVLGALTGAYLWHNSANNSAGSGSAPDAVQSPRMDDSLVRIEDQTPRILQAEARKEAEKDRATVETTENAGTENAEQLWDPARLEDTEYVLDVVAELMRAEWETLVKAIPAEQLELEIAGIVSGKIQKDPKYAELNAAVDRMIDRIGIHDTRLDPDELLVRAGVLPESVLWDPVELPNGETAKLYKNMRLVVKYRRKAQKTEEGLRMIAEAEQKELDVLKRLSDGVPEDKIEPLLGELDEVQKRLEELRAPFYVDRKRVSTRSSEIRGPGAPSSKPTLKVVVIDLGLIE